jgi:two-component system sensor histidine kinase AtoS
LPNNPFPKSLLTRVLPSGPYRELFQVFIDSLDSAVLVVSGDASEILTCNHAFLLLSGYARSDVGALSPFMLFPDRTGEGALSQILASWQRRERQLMEVPMRRRDSAITLVDLRVRASGSQGSPFIVRIRPVAERLQTEERLHAEAIRLRSLSQLAQSVLHDGADLERSLHEAQRLLLADVIGVYRAAASKPEYVCVGELPEPFPPSLPASEVESQAPSDEWMVGQRPSPNLHRAARAADLAALRTITIGRPGAWTGILLAGWRERERVPPDAASLLEIISSLIHANFQVQGILESIRQLEGELNQVREEYAQFSDCISEPVLALDHYLNVLWANPAAANLLGYQPGELDGLAVKDVLVGPDDAMASLLDALGHQRPSERARLTIHRRDGYAIPIRLRAIPSDASEDMRLIVTLTDQSERKAIEDQSEQLAQRALLGEVAAIFAHQVRNPINNISTGVQLVSSRLGKDHPLYESLDRVRKECVRLDQLMGDVLFFARPLELKMVPMQLSDLVERLLARWRPRLERSGIESYTSLDPETPPALIDPRTFEQVIVNIITNALQAMQDGGTLSISLEPSINGLGEMVDLKIADTGPGIPESVLQRIFDPFFTTKKEGTGLGLAIARRILAAHKGVILVKSYPDAGTVFTLRVPAARRRT